MVDGGHVSPYLSHKAVIFSIRVIVYAPNFTNSFMLGFCRLYSKSRFIKMIGDPNYRSFEDLGIF